MFKAGQQKSSTIGVGCLTRPDQEDDSMRRLIGSEFGLLVGLVILFFILWAIVKYGGPVSGIGRVAEKYAQPHGGGNPRMSVWLRHYAARILRPAA